MHGNQAGCHGNWAAASCPGSSPADWAADVGRRRELGADPAEQAANDYQGRKLHFVHVHILNTRLVPSRITATSYTPIIHVFRKQKAVKMKCNHEIVAT